MDPDPATLLELVAGALELKTKQELDDFLRDACGDKPELRAKLVALIEAYRQSGAAPAQPEGPETRCDEATVVEAFRRTEMCGTVIDRYKLLEQLGEGGMGVVWMADQLEPVRRRVALKIIKHGMDSGQVVARFEAERQALALMDHPNIAKVLDAGTTSAGRPYFVMELVRGIPITTFCDEKQLSIRERLELFMPVCQAIQHAHQKGVIHRDIKPTNVLVAIQDGQSVAKVIDFGIAKATGQRLTERTLFTEVGALIGTPEYMSPEQAELNQVDIDTRSDIYSLGVLLYELLTGTTPLTREALRQAAFDEILRRIRQDEPPKPSTRLTESNRLSTISGQRKLDPTRLARQVSGDLDWIVMKTLEKDRTRRYETANGLAMDIQRHLNSEAVLARPPSKAYRFEKLVRRNKLVFAAVSAVTIAVLSGLGASTWLFLREREAHRLTVAAEQRAEHARIQEQQARERAEAGELTAQRNAYSATMLMARMDWDKNNIPHLRRLLTETEDYRERAFEWYYWRRMCHLESKGLRGHLAAVRSVALSPSGQRIASASDDNTVKVWDVKTGNVILTLHGHQDIVLAVAFSADGHQILTGSKDRTVRIWDASTGLQLRAFHAHAGVVLSVAFSPDGQRIASGSSDSTITIWETETTRQLNSFRGHGGSVWSVAFSRDGHQIVSGGGDARVRVWATDTGNELLTLNGHAAAVVSVCYSSDGTRIVSGSWDTTLKIWDAISGHDLLTLKGHVGPVMSVAVSSDGKRLASGSSDTTVKVWELATGHEMFTLKGHEAPVTSVVLYPNGSRVVTGSEDRTVKIWDEDSARDSLTRQGYQGSVRSVAFSSDGRRLVTGSEDRIVKVLDTANGRELLHIEGLKDWVLSVAFSPDGRRIVSGCLDPKVWDAASGRELLGLNGHSDVVSGAAFSSDGKSIVTGSYDRTLKVWNAETGRETHVFKGHSSYVTSVAFSPDGQRIASGSSDSTVKVWDVVSARELFDCHGHTSEVWAVAFSPDGKRIASGGNDRTVRVWDAATGKELVILSGHDRGVTAVGFSHDGVRIVSGSGDHSIRIWDVANGRELLVLRGHTSLVASVAFSPDDKRIASGSVDRTAKLWKAVSEAEISAWIPEDSVGETQSAVLPPHQPELMGQRSARSADEGMIKHWLILAPIPLPQGLSGADALDQEQLEDEARLRPKPAEEVTVDGRKLVWTETHLDRFFIDFNTILSSINPASVAYASANS